MIGTIQSMADYFPGLRPVWRQNQVEERLLGVDLNGQMDSRIVQYPEVLRHLKNVARSTNEEYACLLGINPSAAITTVKPSGNSSQLLNASSGLHARWAPYYIRNIRLNEHSPVLRLLDEAGVPSEPAPEGGAMRVVGFPVKSPDRAVCRGDRDALEQLDYWLRVRTQYTEHQPSVTIHYQPHELEDIILWVQEHADLVAGLSFYPSSDASYLLPPYQDATEQEYYDRLARMPGRVDFSRLAVFENEDRTSSSQEVACLAGGCETV